jgi:nudix-type nucleoside diphosphatase (YffH/AdpP family)
MIEEVIGTESIFNGKIVHLRVDTVRLPNGRESKREVVGHGGAICVVPMQDNQTVLMIRQFRLPAGKILLEVPAGGLEDGENPDDCAMRELQEETGFRAGNLTRMFTMYLAPGYSTELMYAYLATDLSDDKLAQDEDENLELVPMKLDDAIAAIFRGEIEDSKTVAALFAAREILSRG